MTPGMPSPGWSCGRLVHQMPTVPVGPAPPPAAMPLARPAVALGLLTEHPLLTFVPFAEMPPLPPFPAEDVWFATQLWPAVPPIAPECASTTR